MRSASGSDGSMLIEQAVCEPNFAVVGARPDGRNHRDALAPILASDGGRAIDQRSSQPCVLRSLIALLVQADDLAVDVDLADQCARTQLLHERRLPRQRQAKE